MTDPHFAENRDLTTTVTTPRREALGRLMDVIRDIAVGGMASVISGIVVLGLGGRLVMFLSRLLHPEAIGRFTENGNEIGVFTLDGSIGLLVFGGLGSGLIAASVWVVMRPWIPRRSSPIVGLWAVAIGGFQLVAADNPDFVILGDPAIDIALLLGLVFAFGVVVCLLDRAFDRRLPRGKRAIWNAGYVVIAAVGILVAPLGLVAQFAPGFDSGADAPIWTGVFVVATALVTLWWWVDRVRGREVPTVMQSRLGSGFTAAAALAGIVFLTGEILEIL